MWLIVAESGSGVAACGLLGFLLVVVVSGFRASRLRASVFRDLWFSGCLGFVAHCRGFGGWLQASGFRGLGGRDLYFSRFLGFAARCRGFGNWGFGVAGF